MFFLLLIIRKFVVDSSKREREREREREIHKCYLVSLLQTQFIFVLKYFLTQSTARGDQPGLKQVRSLKLGSGTET